jgi:hypothetical protein
MKVTTTPKTKVPGFIRKGKALVFVSGCNKTFSQKTVNRILEEIRVERIKKCFASPKISDFLCPEQDF